MLGGGGEGVDEPRGYGYRGRWSTRYLRAAFLPLVCELANKFLYYVRAYRTIPPSCRCAGSYGRVNVEYVAIGGRCRESRSNDVSPWSMHGENDTVFSLRMNSAARFYRVSLYRRNTPPAYPVRKRGESRARKSGGFPIQRISNPKKRTSHIRNEETASYHETRVHPFFSATKKYSMRRTLRNLPTAIPNPSGSGFVLTVLKSHERRRCLIKKSQVGNSR